MVVLIYGVLLNIAGVFMSVESHPGVVPVLTLNDGRTFPSFGLGTWLGFSKSGDRVPVADNAVEQAVAWAIDAGYRHFDTAAIYNTEEQVGRGINQKIQEGVVNRSDLFITTKLWNDQHEQKAVVPALRDSLKRLNLSYVDLYLIHWPIAQLPNGSLADIDYIETWRGMVEAQNLTLTKSIGVSNFNEHMIDRIKASSSVVPAVLQVELNLNLQQPELLKYCRQNNIAVTGYTPFGSLFHAKARRDAPPPRTTERALVAMSDKYKKTVPQLALKYLMSLGVVPIPKSTTKSRIEANIDIFDFELTKEEKQLFKSYDRGYRTIAVKHWVDSPYYPFEKN